MKTKLALAACVVLLVTAGFDCINSPLNVALNLDPVAACSTVSPGNGSFFGSTNVNLATLIPSSFTNNLRGLRVYDIRVQATGQYPNGVVSGQGFVRFGSDPELQVLSFSGQYSAFGVENGVSLLNSGGLVTAGPGFVAFMSRIATISAALASNSDTALPSVTLRGTGSGPANSQTFGVCIKIYFQADANAN